MLHFQLPSPYLWERGIFHPHDQAPIPQRPADFRLHPFWLLTLLLPLLFIPIQDTTQASFSPARALTLASFLSPQGSRGVLLHPELPLPLPCSQPSHGSPEPLTTFHPLSQATEILMIWSHPSLSPHPFKHSPVTFYYNNYFI